MFFKEVSYAHQGSIYFIKNFKNYFKEQLNHQFNMF